MLDYIDVTKLKPAKSFFTPKGLSGEVRARRKHFYGWLILASCIILVLITMGLWGLEEHFSEQITGRNVLSPDAAADLGPPNPPSAPTPPASPHKSEGILSRTKAALFGSPDSNTESSTQSEHQVKNIDVQSELEFPEYVLSLNNVKVHLETDQHSLTATGEDFLLQTGGSAELNGFTGTLRWKNKELSLEGSFQRYKNTHTEISWGKPQKYKVGLEKGKIQVENTEIALLEGVSSGPLQIGNKLTIQMEKDGVKFESYKGSLVSELNNDQNKLVLKGHVQELSTRTNQFDMELQ